MIRVVAIHKVPEQNLDEFIELGKVIVANSRADEGNISYSLNQLTDDPTIMTIMEEWESPEVLDAHMHQQHFLDTVPKMGALCEGETQIQVYNAVV